MSHKAKKSRRKSKRHKSAYYRGLILLGAVGIAVVYVFAFYHFFVEPFSFRWKAIFQEPVYPEGYNVRGIDVSHYQEAIDWTLVRNANLNNDPIRFVIIKATEGVSLMDEYFNENFYQAKENDFVRGAYHFFVPKEDPVKQAEFFLRQAHLESGDLPPILDIEKTGRLSPQELQVRVKKWLDVVEAHYGVKPIIYASYKFKLDLLNDSIFDEYPYWIAHYYVSELKYMGKWSFWQHTDCGKVDGITGDVDCNIFNGTMKDLFDFTLREKGEIQP